jgi:hypothetical protein
VPGYRRAGGLKRLHHPMPACAEVTPEPAAVIEPGTWLGTAVAGWRSNAHCCVTHLFGAHFQVSVIRLSLRFETSNVASTKLSADAAAALAGNRVPPSKEQFP